MMGVFDYSFIEAENAFQSWLRAKGKTIPTKTKTIRVPTQIVGTDFEAERALREEWLAGVKAKKEGE
jgi:hypothetical protein